MLHCLATRDGRKAGRTIRIVALLLVVGTACGTAGAEETVPQDAPPSAAQPLWPEALVRQGIDPSRLAFPRPPFLASQAAPVPLDLLGLDLRQDGALLKGSPAILTEGVAVTFSLYWRPVGLVSGDAACVVSIQGTGPAFRQRYPLDASEWPLGGVRISQQVLALPRLRYSGRATLTISYEADQATEPQPLYVAPVHINPVAAPSPVKEAALDAFFDFRCVRLGEAFRLGPDASIVLPLPERARANITRVGVVSNTAYDVDFKQGQKVCRLDFLNDAQQVVATTYIRAGISTAKGDRDEYPPGGIATHSIAVFSSRPSDHPSRFSGKPFEVRVYGATLPVDAKGAVAIRATNVVDAGLIEIRDLVFGTVGAK